MTRGKKWRKAARWQPGTHAPLLAFDTGVLVAAGLIAFALPQGMALLSLFTASGLCALCILVITVMTAEIITMHDRLMAATCNRGYRTVISVAIRLTGILVVLGMWFLIPLNLKNSFLKDTGLDTILFIGGLMAILAGVLLGIGEKGAGIVLSMGATLLGVALSLPHDLARWAGANGRGPWFGIGLGVIALVSLIAAGRFINRLDDLGTAVEKWLAQQEGQFASRNLYPFILALGTTFWTALYAELVTRNLSGAGAVAAVIGIGVVPYRLLRLLIPPLSAVTIVTGLASLSLWLAAVS